MNADGSIRAALLTAPVPGAIAVVRIVGADAWRVVSTLLRRNHVGIENIEVARPTLVSIVDGDETLDEALVLRRNRAGFDDIELSVHGGVGVTQRVLGLLQARGITVTRSDELPPPWSIHPIEADVDLALLSCESRRLTQFLLSQRGMLSTFLDHLHRAPEDERSAYQIRTRVAMRLVAGLRVAIVGPPNAGKSTLANALIGRDRIIVADVPGTTRDWVSEIAIVDGWPITLIDTAGIRETTDAIEAEAIRRGTKQAAAADATLVVVDGLRDAQENLRTVNGLMSRVVQSYPALVVVNKSDAMTPDALAHAMSVLRGAMAISARDGGGLDQLRRSIAVMLGLDALDAESSTGFLASHLLPQ